MKHSDGYYRDINKSNGGKLMKKLIKNIKHGVSCRSFIASAPMHNHPFADPRHGRSAGSAL